MAILSKGTDFTTGDQVTAAKLDALVDNATFASDAVDDSTTALDGNGKIIVKDGGITTAKLNLTASVGIGVSSPDEALTIRAGDFGNNQDGGIGIQLGAEDGSHFKAAFKCKTDVNGVARAAIDAPLSSSGGTTQEVLSMDHTGGGLPRVGIGNADPSSILDITQSTGVAEINLNATANDAVLSLNSDTDESHDSEIHFNAGASTKGKIEYNHHVTAASQKMSFFAGDNTERLTIEGNGNIVIANIPTSASGLASGTIYSDSGTLKIVS